MKKLVLQVRSLHPFLHPLIMMSSIDCNQLIDDILMIKEMKGKKFSMDLDMC